MKTPVHHQKLVFLDVETTGTRPNFHEIIDIAIVPWDETEDVFCTKICPTHPDRVSDEAIAVNGYDPSEWEGSPSMPEVYGEITTRLHDRVVCGHRVELDLAFVRSCCGHGSFQCHGIDTMTLAYAHLIPVGLSSLKLVDIASFLGLKRRQAHRALEDALTCRDIYRTIMRETRQRKQGPLPKLDGLGRRQLLDLVLEQASAIEELHEKVVGLQGARE